MGQWILIQGKRSGMMGFMHRRIGSLNHQSGDTHMIFIVNNEGPGTENRAIDDPTDGHGSILMDIAPVGTKNYTF